MNALNKGLPLQNQKIIGNGPQYSHKTPEQKSGKFPGLINTNTGLVRSDMV
jgi:hypothetical protein